MDKTIIKEYFEAVSEKLQKLIMSPDTQSHILEISRKYSLVEEQATQLENEIFMTLLGLDTVSNFRKNLVSELGISYDQALKISFEANEKIFSKVMDELKDMEREITKAQSGQKEDLEETEESQVTQTTPPVPWVQTSSTDFLKKQTESMRADHMIPDHESMEKTDGPHLHSQSVMPQAVSMQTSGTIIDQKLSQIFRSSTRSDSNSRPENKAPANLPTDNNPKTSGYKGKDPYREPIE